MQEETTPTPQEPAPEKTTPEAIAPKEQAPTEAPTEKPKKEEPKKELTPEEKKAKRKAMLKRLSLVSGITYIVIIVFIVVWGFAAGGKELQTFNYLPVSQEGFDNFLMTLFNILWGLLTVAGLLGATFFLIKSLLAKKEEIEKKKKVSRLAMYTGIGFFVAAVLWIVAISLLGPRLVTEERYGSLIITDPVDTTGLTAPITIEFDASEIPIDTSVYEVLSYTWDFGDGDTANGESVSHRYTEKGSADGRYTVVLEVEYMDLKSAAQFSDEFTVEIGIDNELVAAVFTASPESGEIPLEVSFDASGSYDPDGEIVAYDWDMDGDGRYDDAEGEEVEYEFTQEGSFEVSLRVTDNNDEYNVYSLIIEAGSVGGLRAVITSEVAEGDPYYIDEKYEFTGELSSIQDGSITKYSWDFGDGTTVQSRSTSHTYEEAGNYEIILTVTDADGNSDQDILEITVVEEGTPPSAMIDASPESGAVPLEVEFDGSGSSDPDDDIIEYEWDFDGDGTVDETGDSVTHTYDEVGEYEATLTVIDSSGNEDDTSVTIDVSEQGVVAVLEVDTTNGEVPLTVDFDASESTYKEGNIVSYEYDFGDGSDYIGGSGVTYKYTDVGTFEASVTVLSDDGETATDTVQIVVRPVSLTACFDVNTDSGSAPLFLTVDPSCSQGTINSYEWDFGDGEISFDRKPDTHIYSEAGFYTVTLEVTGEEGIVDSYTQTITVK